MNERDWVMKCEEGVFLMNRLAYRTKKKGRGKFLKMFTSNGVGGERVTECVTQQLIDFKTVVL